MDEYRRNNAETERREKSRDRWARAIAIGGILTTLLTLAVAYTGWQQFLLAQNQAHVQLRPYAAVTLDSISAVAEGEKVAIALHYDNVGNTPVYAASIKPFFDFVTDRKIPAAKIEECKGTSARGAVFAKKQDWQIQSDFVINKSHLDLMNAGAGNIIFFARLCYSDVFEEINWTDVCLYWESADSRIRSQYCNEAYNQMVSDAPREDGGGWFSRLVPPPFR